MNRFIFLAALLGLVVGARAETLTLTRTIPLPNVQGRIDHFDLDAVGGRLFLAALGNNTVEVVDLKQGKVTRSLDGLSEPQGILFVPEFNRLYVANGGDGALRVFDGATFAPVAVVQFKGDADNMRYDPTARRVYVGYGSGALGVVDAVKNEIVADIPLAGHPESFQLEPDGPGIFVNVPKARHVAVVDRAQKKATATWSLDSAGANFPMAFDAARHRLFVACRSPASLKIFDSTSGREIARLDLHGDCDDLFFDAARRQLYASCGEGFIDVFSQADADHYALKENFRTVAKARTSFFDGHQIFLAVPRRGEQPAEIRCYKINP